MSMTARASESKSPSTYVRIYLLRQSLTPYPCVPQSPRQYPDDRTRRKPGTNVLLDLATSIPRRAHTAIDRDDKRGLGLHLPKHASTTHIHRTHGKKRRATTGHAGRREDNNLTVQVRLQKRGLTLHGGMSAVRRPVNTAVKTPYRLGDGMGRELDGRVRA